MKNFLINSFHFNLRYARELVADVDDALMTKSPGKGLENHPAFTLGHLISAAALTCKYLGGPYDMDPNWEKLFRRKGPGDPRTPDPDNTLYPTKDQLIKELATQHSRVENLLRELDEARLVEPTTWRFDSFLPTMGDLLFFMCITHASMHLGQLAAWRRAMGLPSALARL